MYHYLFSVIALLAACKAPQNQSSMTAQSNIKFDLQGHRGCRGLMPENTIPAMIKALELGITTLEMDASITADSQVILSHEPFFNHEISTKPDSKPVTEAEEKSLNIYRMPYEMVKKFDVGMLPHPRFAEQVKMATVKPLLSDVFVAVKDWCKKHNKPLPFFNIETKCMPGSDNVYHPAPEAFCELLMNVIREEGMEKKTIIQSFDFRTLVYLRKNYPSIALAALVEPDDKGTLDSHLVVLGFVPNIYSPAYERVDAALVAACKQKGMKLIPWTVNNADVAAGLLKLGVDGLITDYPDRIR
jgi:glycerophosphoryl diester phosphodiesterase